MKAYNVVGYTLIIIHILISVLLSPPEWGPWLGVTVGIMYLLFIWFFGGIYLSDILHMGIAHRAFDFKESFVKFITLFYNTLGIYVDPYKWVNRHRHHHIYADRPGDPNKLSEDGFWKTVYLCFFPYKCKSNLVKEPIFKSWALRLASNPYYAMFAQASSYGILWLLVKSWIYALALWISVRLFGIWVNLIQNYWSHDRRAGTRRYNDEDNAVNIGDWLPVVATFSACLQNNHHHYPNFLRNSHTTEEFDFGLMTVRVMKKMGLVEASKSGLKKPQDIPLVEIGF
jgi:stearoyl-CoA desaturase (delta-9 desaturase)